MAPILCSVPLRGAESTYHLTADCTAEVFSRLVCSVHMMGASYALHKQISWQQSDSTWWYRCAPPSPRSLLLSLEDRPPVQEQLTLAMFLSTTGDSLKAAKNPVLVFKVQTASQGTKRERPLLWLSVKNLHLRYTVWRWLLYLGSKGSKGRKGKIRLNAVQDLGVLPTSKQLIWQLFDWIPPTCSGIRFLQKG